MSPHFLGELVDESVYFTDGSEGVVTVLSAQGEALGAIETGLGRLRLDEAWARLEAGLDTMGLQNLSAFRAQCELDSIPIISDLMVSREGELWLKNYDPAEDTHWRGRRRAGGTWSVFTPDGRRLADLELPADFRLMDVSGDLVAGLVRDGLGVERVEVRRLLRETAAS